MRILERHEQIRHMLSCFEISFARRGYSCLAIAIERVCNGAKPGQMLYEEIAEVKKSTPSKVRANIRYVMRLAQKQGIPLYTAVTGRSSTDALPPLGEFIKACAAWVLNTNAVLEYDSRLNKTVVVWKPIAP